MWVSSLSRIKLMLQKNCQDDINFPAHLAWLLEDFKWSVFVS